MAVPLSLDYYQMQQDSTKAMSIFGKILKNIPASTQDYIKTANDFISIRALDFAEKTYRQGQKKLHGQYSFLFELGYLYFLERKWNKMINAYLDLLRFNESYYSNVQMRFQSALYNDDGTLSLDSSAFSDAMDENYDDVVSLFSGDNGLANILGEMIGNYTGSGGLLSDMVDASQDSADKTEESLENFEYRMELYEEQLRARFTTLDTLLASMSSNGDYLLTQLESLS